MNTPSISIVIPLYNKENNITDTVYSVLEQNANNVELIIVDDGSTDKSYKIVTEIIKCHPQKNIKLIRQKNSGVSATRNNGIKASDGNYILLLDADDILLPHAIEYFNDCMMKYPDKQVYVGGFIENDTMSGKRFSRKNTATGIISEPIKEIFYFDIFLRPGNCLIKKTVFQNLGYFRSDITLYEDMELLLKIEENCSMAAFNQPVMEYKRGEKGLSRTKFSIEKEYAYHASIAKNQGYARKIIADHIFRRIVRHTVCLSFYKVFSLLRNNHQILTMILCFAKREYHKKKHMLRSEMSHHQ